MATPQQISMTLTAKDDTASAFATATNRANNFAKSMGGSVGGGFQEATQQAQIFSQVASGGFKQTELSAKQLTFAARQLPAQFTDIIVSLQGGQPVMQVLLQQGGQLKDLYGGIGNALRGMAGYIAMVAKSLANPFVLGGIAVAGFTASIISAMNEQNKYNQVAIATGRLNEGAGAQLQQIAKYTGYVTQEYGDAKVAVMAFATQGVLSNAQIQQATIGAVNTAKLLGIEIEKTIEMFSKLGNEPTKGLMDFDKQMKNVNISTLRQVQYLEAVGMRAEAASLAINAMTQSATGRRDELGERLNGWGKLMRYLAEWTTNASNNLSKIGQYFSNLGTNDSELQKLQAQLEDRQSGVRFETAGQRAKRLAEIDALKIQISTAQKLKVEADAYVANQERLKGIQKELIANDEVRSIQAQKLVAKYRQVAEAMKAGLISADDGQVLLDKQTKALQGLYGYNPDAKIFSASSRQGSMRDIAGEEAAFRANQANKFMEESMKAQEKLAELQRDIDTEFRDSQRKTFKEKEQLAEKMFKQEMYWNKEAAKYEQLQDEAQDKRMTKRIQDYQREFERVSDNMSRSLSDALMRGFENGKGFMENFRDALVNMFKTTVLQPVIQGVLDGSGITGFATGLGQSLRGGGLASAQAQSGSVISRLGDVFTKSNASVISGIESLGASISNGMGGIRDSIGGFVGQNASAIANGLSYANAALQLSQGNFGGAALTAAGTFFGGPIGGAIGSFIGGSLFGSKKQPPRTVTQLPDVSKQFQATVGAFLAGFGMDSNVTASTSYKGRSGGSGYGDFMASINGVDRRLLTRDKDAYSQASMDAFVNRVLSSEVVLAIQGSNVGQNIKKLFDGLTESSQVANMVQASIALNKANKSLQDAFGITADKASAVAMQSGLVGDELAQVVIAMAETANASRKTSLAMLEMQADVQKSLGGTLYASLKEFDLALKGIDTTTQAGLKAFYDMFKLREQFANMQNTFDAVRGNVDSALYGMMSASEQAAMNQANLAKAFDELNIAVPTSISELIALGKSINYGTEAGLDLALAFPTLVEMFNRASEGVKALTSDLSASYFSTLADFRVAQNSESPTDYIKAQAQTNTELLAEIKALKAENANQQAILLAVAEYSAKQERVLDNWDRKGMPAVRTV